MAATPSGRVRTTIAVDPEVYDAFAEMAHTSGVSLSRCIGDWLRDTSEAAQITTIKLREVRKSPQDAFDAFMRDAIVPEMLRVMKNPKRGPGAGVEQPRPALSEAPSPPPSNTGGKVPRKNPKARS